MPPASLDIYVAAATAIPVLWIGIGLSTGAMGAVIRALRTTMSGQVVVRVGAARQPPLVVSLSFSPLAIAVNGIQLGASTVGVRHSGASATGRNGLPTISCGKRWG